MLDQNKLAANLRDLWLLIMLMHRIASSKYHVHTQLHNIRIGHSNTRISHSLILNAEYSYHFSIIAFTSEGETTD